jgi:competence protein ComEC
MIIGIGYGNAHVVSREAYVSFVGSLVTMKGRVKEDPTRSQGSVSLQLDMVHIGDVPLPGTVLVSLRSSVAIMRGDIVLVKGVIGEPFGSFPASMAATALVSATRPVPGDIGRVVRDWFADHVRQVVPGPGASLGIGFLTGQKSALPEDLAEALRIAGLTHIVVASGYNLTILVQMSRKVFLKVSKFLSAVTSGLMITLFMAITGLSPSMTRAGLVSGLSLLAWYYGRSFHPFVLLPFAAAVTVALQPSFVWGDLGWQLSFVAFAGVMIVAPLLQAYFFGVKEPGIFRQILGETIAAHIVTLPVIALSFGTVSNVAIIANILVVPLVPLAMLLTFACGVWSIAHLPFEWLIGAPTSWLLDYMISVARFVSEIPWAQSEVALPGWFWAIYGGSIAAACWWMWRASKYSFRAGKESLL